MKFFFRVLIGVVIGFVLGDWVFYSTQGSRILFWISKLTGPSPLYFFIQHVWGWPFK